jgi:hypothetical protein
VAAPSEKVETGGCGIDDGKMRAGKRVGRERVGAKETHDGESQRFNYF